MAPHRILHVEDEPDIREVVELSLGLDPDFQTRSCSSGHEALVVAAEWLPDIVLLDVVMPEMDGPDTLARLRSQAQTADIPVVFMTARAQTREIDLFRSLGAAGVIPKPFDPMTLAASVRSYLKPADNGIDAVRTVFLRRLNDESLMLLRYQTALNDDSTSSAALDDIRDIAHGLAGAGGIFGFPEISDVAGALEEAIIVERHGSGSVEEVTRSLDRLLACIASTDFR
jgi:CheY-like chemotaxis protein